MIPVEDPVESNSSRSNTSPHRSTIIVLQGLKDRISNKNSLVQEERSVRVLMPGK